MRWQVRRAGINHVHRPWLEHFFPNPKTSDDFRCCTTTMEKEAGRTSGARFLSVASESDVGSLCAAGRLADALDVLEDKGERVSPPPPSSKRLHAQIMSKCGQMKAVSEAKRVHALLARRGLELDSYLGSGIVDMYVKCGCLAEALRVHYRLPHRNEFSWTALISGHAQCGQAARALSMYQEMRREGVKPTEYTFVQALKACAGLGDLEAGRKVHAHVVHSSAVNAFVGNTLIDMYARCGSLADARQVFDTMPGRDVVSWNTIILGHAESGEGEAALRLYAHMLREGVAPDARTFVAALKACASLATREQGVRLGARTVKVQSLDKGRALHRCCHMPLPHLLSDHFVGATLLDVYAKCGSMADARQVFDALPHRDVVSWNVVILGYAQQAQGCEQAFRLYGQMREQGVAANDATFVSVLRACANAAALETGKHIHARISARMDNLVVSTAVLDMYAKCGSMLHAHRLFDALPLPSKDVVAWSALMGGHARLGDTQRAFHCFHRMRQGGVQPDASTFLALLTACTHAGLVEEAHHVLDAMTREHGLTPTIHHHNCIVDLLGRAGQTADAMAVMEQLPCRPDVVMWTTLLSACRKWGDVQVGRRAFESALRLDQTHAAVYILMASIYAEAHMWKERDSVLQMRDKAGARKEQPGCSWWADEPRGLVHTFVAGDRTHPQSSQIYAKLRQLRARMMEEGYVPDVGRISWDMMPHDAKEEEALCSHSERLAIACALVNTPPATPIRVVKNLRVCDDCHKATAVISKIEGRQIICRDAARFHVFQDGKCSCGDYW